MSTNSAIRASSKVRNLVRAKQQRASLSLQKADWIDLALVPQALAGSRQNYGEFFPMPEWHGRPSEYFADPNSDEALAYHNARMAELEACDKRYADFCTFVASLPLPPVPERVSLDEEREMVRRAREADPESDTLIALECWVEVQAERLAERVNRTVERSYLQTLLDATDRAVAAYLGIEPRKSELVPVANGKSLLRELGARQ
jgi:hypothetical protein